MNMRNITPYVWFFFFFSFFFFFFSSSLLLLFPAEKKNCSIKMFYQENSFLFLFCVTVQLCSLTWWNTRLLWPRTRNRGRYSGRETAWLIQKTAAGQRKHTTFPLPFRREGDVLSVDQRGKSRAYIWKPESLNWLYIFVGHFLPLTAGHILMKLVLDIDRPPEDYLWLH